MQTYLVNIFPKLLNNKHIRAQLKEKPFKWRILPKTLHVVPMNCTAVSFSTLHLHLHLCLHSCNHLLHATELEKQHRRIL